MIKVERKRFKGFVFLGFMERAKHKLVVGDGIEIRKDEERIDVVIWNITGTSLDRVIELEITNGKERKSEKVSIPYELFLGEDVCLKFNPARGGRRVSVGCYAPLNYEIRRRNYFSKKV